MERRGYWRIFTKGCKSEHQGYMSTDLSGKDQAFWLASQISYGGRLLSLETYLSVPTFLRRGYRPTVKADFG